YFGVGLGAWEGGTNFRHKTQKNYFQLTWSIVEFIDAVIMYWMSKNAQAFFFIARTKKVVLTMI
ncbi:hypothetical protein ACJBW7_10725, partial [Streptococcus suis]